MADGVFIACHRCGVRSEVVYVNGPDEWDFCGHHGRQHHARLTELGFDRISLIDDDCDSEVIKQ